MILVGDGVVLVGHGHFLKSARGGSKVILMKRHGFAANLLSRNSFDQWPIMD